MLGMVHLGAGEWLDDLARWLQQRAEQRFLRLREHAGRGGWFLAADIHVRKAGGRNTDGRSARGPGRVGRLEKETHRFVFYDYLYIHN